MNRNYLEALMDAYRAGKVRRGVVTEAFVMHEHDCPFPDGRGPCNCSPDVKLVTPEEEPKA